MSIVELVSSETNIVKYYLKRLKKLIYKVKYSVHMVLDFRTSRDSTL